MKLDVADMASVERMVAMNTGPALTAGDLPTALQYFQRANKPAPFSAAVAAGAESRNLPLMYAPPRQAGFYLADIEKETIQKALEETRGDRGKAAHMLGIGRTTLYRKLKEYRIES